MRQNDQHYLYNESQTAALREGGWTDGKRPIGTREGKLSGLLYCSKTRLLR